MRAAHSRSGAVAAMARAIRSAPGVLSQWYAVDFGSPGAAGTVAIIARTSRTGTLPSASATALEGVETVSVAQRRSGVVRFMGRRVQAVRAEGERSVTRRVTASSPVNPFPLGPTA